MAHTLPRVLIADDDSDTRALIVRSLRGLELELIEARDGEQTLALAREFEPDLILLDVNMPRQDGMSVCIQLRALDPDLAIAMVTSADDLETIKRAYDAGATDFLVKPFNRTVLGQRVRHLLRAARTFDALRESQARLEQAQRLAQLGHWQWQLASDAIECSDEAYRIFGAPPGVALNSRLVEVSVHRDDLVRLKEAVRTALKTKRAYALEHRIVRPGGGTRTVEHRGEPSMDKSGRVQGMFGTIRDITAQKQAEDRIRHLAYYDELTGLPNRMMMREQVARALVDASSNELLVAVMSLDLDRFKRINDSLGHALGDKLLDEIGRRLRESLRAEQQSAREGDFVARVGEDGFALVLHTARGRAYELAKVAGRMLAAVRVPLELSGQEVFPSASIGIAVYPFDGEDVETLVKNADAAMFHAKGVGRDSYQFYSKSMNASAVAKLTLEAELKRAIEGGDLSVVYQPKRELQSGRIVGAEALIRRPATRLHDVNAAQIIAMAEETGMIHELGSFVLRTALTQTRAWQAQGRANIKMSVNLSPLQFRKGGLAAMVGAMLRETGLEARYLELEITEGTVMHNEAQAIDVMNELNALGIGLSIDDFGVGYSSLGYLARFPIDCLKIDRSFIRDLPQDQDQAVVTRGIISMARGLELITVAEGVDSEAQVEFLRNHGCDQVQGYIISAPVPAEEFERRFLLAAPSPVAH